MRDTSEVDICTKRVISHQLTEEVEVANCRLQFESHQWVFERTPGDISGDQHGLFFHLQLQLTKWFLCCSVIGGFAGRDEENNFFLHFEVLGLRYWHLLSKEWRSNNVTLVF